MYISIETLRIKASYVTSSLCPLLITKKLFRPHGAFGGDFARWANLLLKKEAKKMITFTAITFVEIPIFY